MAIATFGYPVNTYTPQSQNWEEQGKERNPLPVKITDDSLAELEEGLIDPGKFFAFSVMGDTLDTVLESLLVSAKNGPAKLFITIFPSSALSGIEFFVEVREDVQSGKPLVKAATVHGTTILTTTLAAATVAELTVLIAEATGLIAGTTGASAIAVGFAASVLVGVGLHFSGLDDDFERGVETIYNYVERAANQVEASVNFPKFPSDVKFNGIVVKEDFTTSPNDEYIYIPNADGAQIFSLKGTGNFLVYSESSQGGNDFFVRAGEINIDPDHQKHSIINGSVGEDTISYGQVTNFTEGLEINLQEGVSTPRGENYGVPLDLLDSIEHAVGTNYNDSIIGTNSDNLLIGRAGNDTIIGGGKVAIGKDLLYGDEGNDSLEGGPGIDKLYGGIGNDTLKGGADTDSIDAGGGTDYLYGEGGADIFNVANGSFVMDATSEDFLVWGGERVTGGIQQPWMEGGWAYYTPWSGLAHLGGLAFYDLLGAATVLLDLAIGVKFRFGLTESNQLLVQMAGGRGGQAVIQNYELDLETGASSANVVAFRTMYTQEPSLQKFTELVNLATKAGFGYCFIGSDPLVLDLDGDGYEISRVTSRKIYFDMDNDNFAERTSWVKPDDGFLVRDLNGNGKIDNITEMFGNATTKGLTALKALDSKADNTINSSDTAFASLRVWRDLNSNGTTESGELQTLAAAGIKSISLNGTTTSTTIKGSILQGESTFTRTDGTTSKVGDFILENYQMDTQYLGNKTVSAAAATLPNLKGFGLMPDLSISMTNDATLLSRVTTFKNLAVTTTWANLKSQADDVLFRWAKVDTVAPTAMGSNFDTQKLAFLEKYMGYQLTPRDAAGKPSLTNVNELINTWNEVLDNATVRLAAQGPLKTVIGAIPYNAATDVFVATTPTALADAYKLAIAKLSTTPATALTQWNSSWAPILREYGDALLRQDKIQIKPDYAVQSLIKALDGTTAPLTLAQLATGLGITAKIGTASSETLSRGTATGLQVYVGDAGNDTLNGGNGQDVYVFGKGFGKDTIIDTDSAETGDRIRLALYNPDQVTIKRVNDDLVISINGTSDSITVKDQYKAPTIGPNGLPISANRAIEDIQFGNGKIFEASEIAAAVGKGTSASETITGTAFADEIEGLKGNDTLLGGDDGDLYYYTKGDGNDVINDIMSNPLVNAPDTLLLLGITQNDLKFLRDGKSNDLKINFGWSGDSITLKDQFKYNATGFETRVALDNRIEVIFFQQGGALNWYDLQKEVLKTYTTSGNDITHGFGTSDELFSSTGNDSLIGLDGGDIYHVSQGTGNDTITDGSQYPETFISGLVGFSWGADDEMTFDAGILPEDVIFTRTGEDPDLLITFKDSNDSILVKGQFLATKLDLFNLLGLAWFNRVEKFTFSDGITLSWEDVLKKVTAGTDGNDSLYGTWYNDTLDGGKGDDFLSGQDENDTYIFGKGYGNDVILEGRTNILSANNDVLKFKTGITVADVVFSRDPDNLDDLLISLKNAPDTLRIKGQYDVVYTGVFGGQTIHSIERFVWADGTEKTFGEIAEEVVISYNRPQSDLVLGTHGNDLMDGGGGNDTMNGGDGSDTYLFRTNSGNDVINDDTTTILAEDDDKIVFGPGMLSTKVKIERDGNNLENAILTFTGISNTLKILGQFESSTISFYPHKIESLVFADGITWNAMDLRAKYILQKQTTRNDTIIGFDREDTIVGGKGNDSMDGASRNDLFIINKGDGMDTVLGYTEEDTISFGAGISWNTLTFSKGANAENIRINLPGGGYVEVVRIVDRLWGTEFFKFADGTLKTSAEMTAAFLTKTATAGNDMITGFVINDTITGGAGNDILDGRDGADTYIFSKGFGNDTIYDETGNQTWLDVIKFGTDILSANTVLSRPTGTNDLVITFTNSTDKITVDDHFNAASNGNRYYSIEKIVFANGTVWEDAFIKATVLNKTITTGNDTIYGFKGVENVINGLAGNDSILGESWDDTLTGAAGNDTLVGDAGDDLLVGGAGTDSMTGGFAADVFDFNSIAESKKSAADTITDFNTTDDKIDLRGLGFTGIVAGAATGTKLGFVYDSVAKDTIITAVSDFKIILDGNKALDVSDFIFS